MGVQLPRVGVRVLVAYVYEGVCVIDRKYCASRSPMEWGSCEFVMNLAGDDGSG